MPANGEERKIELIGTSDAVPYGKIEKILADRDVSTS
jgi:hypothetical protein